MFGICVILPIHLSPMSQPYIIRKIRLSDADKFSKLRIRALRTDPNVFVMTLQEEQLLSSDEIVKYIVKNYVLGLFTRDDDLIGALVYMEQERQKFKHIGILGGMYVDPLYRGFGLGKKLLSTMLHNLKKVSHLTALQLKVVTTNIPAIRLYESFGFSVWATEKKALLHDGNFFDQHHMMLSFDPV